MKNFFLCLFLTFGPNGLAQLEEDKQQIVERSIEFIGDNLEDSDIDLTTFFDDLYFFFDNPINLNQTTFDQLKRLHLLSDVQIQSFLNYINRHGPMITIYELNAIESIDRPTIEIILPFVQLRSSMEKKFEWKNAIRYAKNEIFFRYERVLNKKAGYIDQSDSVLTADPDKQYLGSPDKVYIRYRNTHKDRISWGLTAEKDAGEEIFGGTNKLGFDYYSAHFYVKGLWKFKKLAVGDFQVNFGQGLTMWSGFGMGKSADVFSGRRFAYGIRPYTSVNESQFLRGAGFSLDLGNKLDFTAFGSYKKIDASISAPDTAGFFDNSFSSFQTSGYHRTVGEMEDKDAVGELIAGGELAFKEKTFRIGFSSVYTKYERPLSTSLKPHNQFKFNGEELLTSGVNYRYHIRKISFFGETSFSDNLKFGTVNGLVWHADPKLDFLAIYRNYDKAFQSLYSAAFGESSDNTAEYGLYFGIEARLSKRISASAYYDQFQHRYFKWVTDDFSEGRDVFVQFNFKVNHSSSVYIRLRNKITERNTKDDITGIDGQVGLNKTNIRLNYDQRITPQLSLKSRLEWTRHLYGDDLSNGLLMFQDIVYGFRRVPLKLYTRLAIFDTDSYNARIYAYENDLLYVFSIPSYYNRGIRTYLMAKYELGKKIVFWARFGLWSYQNVDTISSGLEEINGQNKIDIKLQLKIRI